MDVLTKIYNALKADPLIFEKVENRFKYYEYPKTADVTKPHIIIAPLGDTQGDYADNEPLTEENLVQIDVWAKTRADKDALGKQIQKVMRSIGFPRTGSSVDEYDEDAEIFRDGRRYNCKIYINELFK